MKTKKTVSIFGTVVVLIVGCNKDLQETNETTVSEGGSMAPVFVDLGLPSGTQWATSNVGATKPEDIGYRVSWGETQEKNIYGIDTYRYYDAQSRNFTKYYYITSQGTLDLFVLEPCDDAATALYGEEICTPTDNDWRELLKYCTFKWDSRNGVVGCSFTSVNGNSIFLPYVDFIYNGSGAALGGDWGSFYWSSSITATYNSPYCFLFDIDKHKVSTILRYIGVPVRPVLHQKKQ